MTNQYETQLFFKPPPRSNLLHANSCLTFNPVKYDMKINEIKTVAEIVNKINMKIYRENTAGQYFYCELVTDGNLHEVNYLGVQMYSSEDDILEDGEDLEQFILNKMDELHEDLHSTWIDVFKHQES